MKNKILTLLFAAAAVLSVSSCQRNLNSESGLYAVPLTHTYKADVDGFWISDKPNPYAKQRSGFIYMPKLQVDKMAEDHPNMAKLLQKQMHEHMVKEMSASLAKMNQESKLNWQITNSPSNADITIELAVVKFKPQSPVVKVLNAIGGWFINVPGVSNVVGKFSQGSICVEGVFKDARTGKPMAAFKDSNRKTVRLYHKNAYEQLGQADENMKLWAKRIAHVIYATHFDASGRVTLSDQIKDRSIGDVIKNKSESKL
ncbi:MAG: DUF3313 family protein [Akkermansia sp.]